MNGFSVSSDDVIEAYKELLANANYENALLRARLAANERREQAQLVAAGPTTGPVPSYDTVMAEADQPAEAHRL